MSPEQRAAEAKRPNGRTPLGWRTLRGAATGAKWGAGIGAAAGLVGAKGDPIGALGGAASGGLAGAGYGAIYGAMFGKQIRKDWAQFDQERGTEGERQAAVQSHIDAAQHHSSMARGYVSGGEKLEGKEFHAAVDTAQMHAIAAQSHLEEAERLHALAPRASKLAAIVARVAGMVRKDWATWDQERGPGEKTGRLGGTVAGIFGARRVGGAVAHVMLRAGARRIPAIAGGALAAYGAVKGAQALRATRAGSSTRARRRYSKTRTIPICHRRIRTQGSIPICRRRIRTRRSTLICRRRIRTRRMTRLPS